MKIINGNVIMKVNINSEYGKLKFVDFTETAKDGGAFRCITCPIERK